MNKEQASKQQQSVQLLEIYTEGMGDHLNVTSLGFFPTVKEARKHLEDFLRVEVLQDDIGTAKIEDEFIIKQHRTIYINDDGSFEWHIIKPKVQR